MRQATASDENVSFTAAVLLDAPNAPVASPPHPASTSEHVTKSSSSASNHLCVVLHPPDEGFWLKFTWLLSFTSSFIFDGVCLLLILFDARIGMVNSVPSQTLTLEHIATVFLFRYLIEPFSCAYINRYGFRYCLFVGSLLAIMWVILLLRSTGNTFIFEYCIVSAIIGGMGTIKTTFSVLLSSLFLVNRQRAHLSRHLGSFTGMMLIPPVTEFVLLRSHDWQSALYLHLVLMCSLLVFWLFVVTPVPLKIYVVDEEPPEVSQSQSAVVSTTIARNAENLSEKLQFPTIWNTIIECIINSNKYFEYLMATTRVFTTSDLNEETRKRCEISLCSIAMRRVLISMYDTSIWCSEHFILMLASEALIYASRFLPFAFIKGPPGHKSSAEAMITLIGGCLDLISGRSIGYLLHETSSHCVVPLYHVSLVLTANGLSLFLCTTGNIVKMLPYFGLFGFVFVTILQRDQLAPTSNGNIYIFAGILMTAGGVSMSLLRQDMSETAAVIRSLDHGYIGPTHFVESV